MLSLQLGTSVGIFFFFIALGLHPGICLHPYNEETGFRMRLRKSVLLLNHTAAEGRTKSHSPWKKSTSFVFRITSIWSHLSLLFLISCMTVG